MTDAQPRPGSAADDEARYDAERIRLVKEAVVTVMGLQVSSFCTYALLALGMLSVAIGGGIAATRTMPAETVMLFIATTMAMVGVVAAVGAVLSARAMRRDPLDAVLNARPRRPRSPRNMPAGIAVLVISVLVGLALGIILMSESVALGAGVIVAFVLFGLIGPASAMSFIRAESELAAQLEESPELRSRFDDTVPLWVHQAITDATLDERRAADRRRRFADRVRKDSGKTGSE